MKNIKLMVLKLEDSGAGGEIRTLNLWLRGPLLYPVELRLLLVSLSRVELESIAYKANALTIELQGLAMVPEKRFELL